ncbi:MAG: type III-A CRISPR-associated protein Cas10/Csm1 [Cryomorphaceae bacterium]|nr:type III-A CRISPR-associated protein Cas10/Csm1 [Cryomorphaceae bacterium]
MNQSTNPKMKYLLKGDISGIQDFIFNVSSKGAAKTLKVRSYMVQVIGHLAYKKALNTLPEAELFYDGGGSFFVFFSAEDKNSAEESAKELRSIINNSLLHHNLSIAIAWVDLKEDFGSSWQSVRKASNHEKLRMNQDTIGFFEPFEKDLSDSTFNEENVSEEIKNKLRKLGNDLSDDNQLYCMIAQEWIKQEKHSSELFDENLIQNKGDFDGSLVNKLPFWGKYSELEKYQEYRTNHESEYWDNSELKTGNIIDFDAFGDFAAHRTGTNKIAVLKLDVDNLGQKFGDQNNAEIAKELSRQFSDFFDKELFDIYKKECFCISGEPEKFEANIYPIFAGGDDCFIIGAWDAVLCFAEILQRRFEGTFNNENTISAGIVITDPTLPVKAFSEMAEEALAIAKQYKEETEQANEKNKVCLFDMVFSWQEYRYILKFSRELRHLMETQDINRSYLDKIRKSAKGFNALQNNDGINFDKIYKLKYYISRQNEKLKGLVELLFEPYYESLQEKLLTSNKKLRGTTNTAIYPTSVRITELLTRKKLDYESRE